MPDRITKTGRAPRKKKPVQRESKMQQRFVLEVKKRRDPHSPYFGGLHWIQADLLHAIPNGSSRHPAEAQRLKLEGVRPGIPDLFLPVPVEPHHGLYLEAKAPRGSTSDAQDETIEMLRGNGYAVEEFRTWEDGIEILDTYLRGRYEGPNA